MHISLHFLHEYLLLHRHRTWISLYRKSHTTLKNTNYRSDCLPSSDSQWLSLGLILFPRLLCRKVSISVYFDSSDSGYGRIRSKLPFVVDKLEVTFLLQVLNDHIGRRTVQETLSFLQQTFPSQLIILQQCFETSVYIDIRIRALL